MKMLVRCLVCGLVLAFAPFCMAQVVTVRIVNASDGHPLEKQKVSVGSLSLETDANGKAQFNLPEPAPAHLMVLVTVDWGRWHCRCGTLAATKDVIQTGIVESAADSKKSAAFEKATPGEILFVVRPLSFFERLFYPLLKG